MSKEYYKSWLIPEKYSYFGNCCKIEEGQNENDFELNDKNKPECHCRQRFDNDIVTNVEDDIVLYNESYDKVKECVCFIQDLFGKDVASIIFEKLKLCIVFENIENIYEDNNIIFNNLKYELIRSNISYIKMCDNDSYCHRNEKEFIVFFGGSDWLFKTYEPLRIEKISFEEQYLGLFELPYEIEIYMYNFSDLSILDIYNNNKEIIEHKLKDKKQ